MSLHNGRRTFVVNGPARSLYGLVTSLRKVRAPTGDDDVLSAIDILETFVEVIIEADVVERFYAVVGNEGESFKTAQ